MAAIEIFKNESFGEVRVAGTSEEPLFCLADVCRVLEIKNVADCKSRLDQRGVVLTDTPTHNQYGAEVIQKLVYINEKNLYEEYTRLEKESEENECYGNIADKFYDGYVRMESAFKKLLAETTQVNIGKSF